MTLHRRIIDVPNIQILPITVEAAREVASNLRPDDLREVVEGHGVDPTTELLHAAHNSSSVYFTVPNGKTAGMGGIGSNGNIWMVCTPVIHNYPVAFIKEAKRFVDSRT